MIEFKDYPDTSTLLNAENINANFNELNNRVTSNGISDTNADDYMYSGMYYLTTGCSNVPTSYIKLFVNGEGGNDVAQIAIDTINNRMYSRTKSSGIWNNWAEEIRWLGTKDNINLDIINENCEFYANHCTNIPSGAANGYFTSRVCNSDWQIQTYKDAVEDIIYERRKRNNSWGIWKKSTLT